MRVMPFALVALLVVAGCQPAHRSIQVEKEAVFETQNGGVLVLTARTSGELRVDRGFMVGQGFPSDEASLFTYRATQDLTGMTVADVVAVLGEPHKTREAIRRADHTSFAGDIHVWVANDRLPDPEKALLAGSSCTIKIGGDPAGGVRYVSLDNMGNDNCGPLRDALAAAGIGS